MKFTSEKRLCPKTLSTPIIECLKFALVPLISQMGMSIVDVVPNAEEDRVASL